MPTVPREALAEKECEDPVLLTWMDPLRHQCFEQPLIKHGSMKPLPGERKDYFKDVCSPNVKLRNR